jgi:PPP family 3-phenylpropionic acid transporter
VLTPTHISQLYFVFFYAHGISVPYLPIALERSGFSGEAIGALLAVMLGVQVATPPLWGYLADRFQLNARLVLIASAGAAVGMAIAALAPGNAGMLAGVVLFSLFRTPMSPLLDALTLGRVGAAGYGRVRRWGSLGFVCAAFLTGLYLDHMTPRQIPGLVAIVWVLLLALALVLGMATAPLPARPPTPQFGKLYADRRVWWFLVVCALHFACGIPFDSYFALHAKKVGLAGMWVGTAWALGVLVEVAVLTHLEWLVARLGPKRILAIAFTAGVVRWTLTALVPGGVALALIQAAHGVTFGAFFGASVVWMNRVVPPELRSSAQAVYAAFVWGCGGILGQLICGPVYAQAGGRALFAGAAVLELVPLIALMFLREPD